MGIAMRLHHKAKLSWNFND